MFSVATIAIAALVVTATGYSSGSSPDTIILSNGTLNDTSSSPMTAPLRPLHAHRIVCVGDSITEGFPDPDNWPSQLKARLGGDWEVVNQGVGGAFTADMRDHMNAALDVNPGFVIIAGGMNDLRNGIPLETTQVNIAAMCARVESGGAVPVLFTVTPTSDRMEHLDELNAWITEYAHLKGYDLIDFYAALNDKSNPGYSDPALVSDGKHPNAAGYAAMGTVIDLGIFTGGIQDLPQQSTAASTNETTGVFTSNT